MTTLPVPPGGYPLGIPQPSFPTNPATLGQLLAGMSASRGTAPTLGDMFNRGVPGMMNQAQAMNIGSPDAGGPGMTAAAPASMGQIEPALSPAAAQASPPRGATIGDLTSGPGLDVISRAPGAKPAAPNLNPLPVPAVRPQVDYEKMRSDLMGEVQDPSKLQKILMILGPMFAAFGNQDDLASRMIGNLYDRRDMQLKHRDAVNKQIGEWRYEDWKRDDEAAKDAAKPYTIGNRRLAFDPATGQTATQYTAPQDWEDYATSFGYQPGTDEYNNAMRDAMLKSSGPTAYGFDTKLDDHRTDNDIRAEGIRQGNRLELEGARQGNRVGLENVRQQGRTALRGTLTAEQQARLRGPGGERPSKIVTDGKGNYQGVVNGRYVPLALPASGEY